MYSLLIVDDETDIVESIAYDIPWEDIGISELYCAYDGEQALKLAAEKRIDVVLSDIQMPKLNGILLAEQLHRRFDHTKIIFMTGFDRFEYAREAVEHGVFRYILKPASNEELMNSVAAALDAVRAEIEKQQALENVGQQLIHMQPFIIQRIMNYYIAAGRIGMRQAIDMAGDAGIVINPDDIYTLLLLRIDPSDKKMDTEKNRTMLKFQLVAEGILTVLGKSEKAAAGPRLSLLSEYPAFSLLVDSLDLAGALDKLSHILGQAKTPDGMTGEQILQIYYEVSGTLLSASRNRGIHLSDWAGGQEEFFYG